MLCHLPMRCAEYGSCVRATICNRDLLTISTKVMLLPPQLSRLGRGKHCHQCNPYAVDLVSSVVRALSPSPVAVLCSSCRSARCLRQ